MHEKCFIYFSVNSNLTIQIIITKCQKIALINVVASFSFASDEGGE